MSVIFKNLPKDIQYIVNDFLKDKTQYDLMLKDFSIVLSIKWDIVNILRTNSHLNLVYGKKKFNHLYGCDKRLVDIYK